MAVVLVADDEPDILELLAIVLDRAGHEVHTARDGQEAWDTMLRQPLDVAVLDVMMPRVSGLQVLTRCRAHEATSRLPVLLLSACTGVADVEEGFAAGADRYMTKPFSPRAVAGAVADLVARQPV